MPNYNNDIHDVHDVHEEHEEHDEDDDEEFVGEIPTQIMQIMKAMTDSETKREKIENIYKLISLFFTKNGKLFIFNNECYRFRKNLLIKIKEFSKDDDVQDCYKLVNIMIELHNLIVEHDKLY